MLLVHACSTQITWYSLAIAFIDNPQKNRQCVCVWMTSTLHILLRYFILTSTHKTRNISYHCLCNFQLRLFDSICAIWLGLSKGLFPCSIRVHCSFVSSILARLSSSIFLCQLVTICPRNYCIRDTCTWHLATPGCCHTCPSHLPPACHNHSHKSELCLRQGFLHLICATLICNMHIKNAIEVSKFAWRGGGWSVAVWPESC